MKCGWTKLGCLYCPSEYGRHRKLLSHASNPLPVRVHGDVYRVFYCGRDSSNRSSVGAVDIDIVERQIIQELKEPAFEHGPEGVYFSDGISIGNCYFAEGILYMLFMGWRMTNGGRWRGEIGRFIVNADLSLEVDPNGPLLGCDESDQISLSYPWVSRDASGGFRMWYGSTLSWDAGNGEMLHVIKSAQSVDGKNWSNRGLAVPYELGLAQAFSRPSVIRNPDGSFEMWFSYRGDGSTNYRIGYAASPDGIEWELELHHNGLAPEHSGWDSEMVEYPFVFRHEGVKYMLYNGNSYGKTGFGLARYDCLPV